MQRAAVHTTRSMAATWRCSEAGADHDEEQDRIVEVTTMPNNQPSGAMASHGAQGDVGAIVGNLLLSVPSSLKCCIKG